MYTLHAPWHWHVHRVARLDIAHVCKQLQTEVLLSLCFAICGGQALEMLTSLCMFEEAKQLAEQAAAGQLLKGGAGRGAAAVAELMGRQAAWSEETANYEAAAEMYIKVNIRGRRELVHSLNAKIRAAVHGPMQLQVVTVAACGGVGQCAEARAEALKLIVCFHVGWQV